MTRIHRIAAGFFFLATSLGVLLRLSMLEPISWLNFGNALHAHSHTLYFGWAALGLLTLMFQRLRATDRAVRTLLYGIATISAATFVAMLTGGYSLPGIIVSSLSLIAWAAAAILFFRRARGSSGVELSFLRLAVVYLMASGVSALTRVVFLVTHADPLFARLAVFGFLHLFASFFVFACIGLLLWTVSERGARFDAERLRLSVRLFGALSFLTFPLGVAGGASGLLGVIAKIAAVALLMPVSLLTFELFRATPRSLRAPVRSLAVLFAVKAVMEASGALPFAELAVALRQPVVLYLHVLLLGFVSGTLILLVRLQHRFEVGSGFWLHQSAVLLMTLGLGLCSGAMLLPSALSSLLRPGLFIAAVAGALVVVAAAFWAAPLFLLSGLRRTVHDPAHPVR